MQVYLTHLGCRLNESEVEELAGRFVMRDHEVVASPDAADICVVNSCTVTGEAGRKTRQLIRRLARRHPNARIAVTGCHATLFPEELARLPNVDWIIHNEEKDLLVDLVDGGGGRDPIASPQRLGPGAMGRTRAFVKVQDGCDNACSFCITTVARGSSRSRPMREIITKVRRLVDAAFQEVVLTGVHLGAYGLDQGVPDGLRQLVKAILIETDVARLRLSSLEPWDLEVSFFDLWANERLCRQLHLPLQSGSDKILRLMRRRTHTKAFSQLVDSARERIPDLALTTDVMVGFPGEEDNDFAQTCEFVEESQVARVHVFPYSPRPGTVAALMPMQVPKSVRVERSRIMRRLGEKMGRDYHASFVGRTLPVLWEGGNGNGVWAGLTDNYLSVKTATATNLTNRITLAQMVKANGCELKGVVVSQHLG